jgi:PST family polysaccharide transporter
MSDSTVEADEIPAGARGENLAPILRRGAKISAGALLFTQLVSLVQTMALARILSPYEVGVFYAGTVLTTFLLTLSEGGLRSALVQRQRGIEEAANTAFWVTLWAGVLWAVLALLAAPLVGLIFGNSTAGLIAAATAGSLVLHALTTVPEGLLQRRFDFRQRILVQPSVVLAFAATSVSLCALGMGVWGLVVAWYVSQLVWVAVSWTLASWRPRRGLASIGVWREMARYGMPLFIGAAAHRAQEVFNTVVIGRVLSAAALGNYRYGVRLGMLPGAVIIEVASYVLFPAFSRTANDAARFKSGFLRALRALWLAAAPTAGMIAVFGVPVTVLLLGQEWRDAGLTFAALAGACLGVAMAAVGFEAIKGHGRTALLNWVNGTEIVVGVVSLLVLVQFGPVGIGLSISISALWGGLLGLLLARNLVGVAIQELTETLLPPLAAALIAALSWGPLEYLVVRSDQRGLVWGLAVLVCEVSGFMVTYGAVLLLVARGLRSRVFTWSSVQETWRVTRHSKEV